MTVLRNLARGAASAAAKVARPIADAFGIPEPTPDVDRLAQLQAAIDAAALAVNEAREDLELAYLESEEGAPNRIPAAENALQAAEATLERCQMALNAQRTVRDRRAVEDARKGRRETWRKAEELAQDRVAAAGKLADALRAAGKHYQDFVRLGIDAYNAIPQSVRWPGGPSSYRLGVGDCVGLVGIDVQRAGLPDGAHISPSMLDQYPSVLEVAESTAAMIRQQHAEDGGK